MWLRLPRERGARVRRRRRELITCGRGEGANGGLGDLHNFVRVQGQLAEGEVRSGGQDHLCRRGQTLEEELLQEGFVKGGCPIAEQALQVAQELGRSSVPEVLA